MIHAILGAFKAADLQAKAIALGIILAVLAGIFGLGFLKGTRLCEEKALQHMAAQAMNALEHHEARTESVQRVEDTHRVKNEGRREQEQTIKQDVTAYAKQPKAKPCVLPYDYTELVDRVTRLQAAADKRLSQAERIPGAPQGVQAESVTTDHLLLYLDDLAAAKRESDAIILEMQEMDGVRYQEEMKYWQGLTLE